MVTMRLSSRPRAASRIDSDIAENWRPRGNCATLDDPDIMYPFPSDTAAEMRAVKVCVGCPVIDQCATWALKHAERHGIWGGMTERERAHRLSDRTSQCPRCLRPFFQRHFNQVYCLACRKPPAGSRAERMTSSPSEEKL